MEHGVPEHFGATAQGGRKFVVDGAVEIGDVRRHAERGPDRLDDRGGRRLVEGHANGVAVDDAQVDPMCTGRRGDRLGPAGNPQCERVEERVGHDVEPRIPQRESEDRRETMHATSDALQTLRPVVHGVEARNHREQHLRGTDVARRLLAADVLLARLEREPQRGSSGRVDRDPDEPAGQRAFVFLADRDEPGVRPAEHRWDAEALRGTDDDVDADGAGRPQQHHREQVGRDGDQCTGRVTPFDDAGVVAEATAAPRILQERAEHGGGVQIAFGIADDDVDTEGLGACRDDRDRLRMTVGVDEDGRRPLRRESRHHCHRLRGRGALVEQ